MTETPQHRSTITLLGPQPRDFRDVAEHVQSLDFDGRIALITAGWQENELDHGALVQAINHDVINLELHARSEQVAAREQEFVQAWARRQKRLRHLQEFYRVRIESIDDAAHTINVRHVSEELREEQRSLTVSQLRHLDREHLSRCKRVCDAFDELHQPAKRPALIEHRRQIAELLDTCGLVVISGGHVVALLNRLLLFDLPRHLQSKPIIAWSAGAMVLTDRIVLFHDHPPFGKNLAQLLDYGLGFCPNVVALPDVSRRVNLDQQAGIGRFARRMAPARCLGLDPGASLSFENGKLTATNGSAHMTEAGTIDWEWTP